jgi:hypothetical protein
MLFAFAEMIYGLNAVRIERNHIVHQL